MRSLILLQQVMMIKSQNLRWKLKKTKTKMKKWLKYLILITVRFPHTDHQTNIMFLLRALSEIGSIGLKINGFHLNRRTLQINPQKELKMWKMNGTEHRTWSEQLRNLWVCHFKTFKSHLSSLSSPKEIFCTCLLNMIHFLLIHKMRDQTLNEQLLVIFKL